MSHQHIVCPHRHRVPGTGCFGDCDPRYDAKYCPPGGCVVSKIEDFRRVLLDPKSGKPEKQQALKFLVHFLQDLHNPVHVGDTPGAKAGI